MLARFSISLLVAFIPMAAHADTFIRSQTLNLNIDGEVSGLEASQDGRFAVVYGDAGKYWLLSYDNKVSLIPLFNHQPEKQSSADATQTSRENNDFRIKDRIRQVQWSNNELILFADKNTYFYQPVKNTVNRSYPILEQTHDSVKKWSAKHHVLIHGAEVLDNQGKLIQTDEDKAETMHPSQSGLLLTADGDHYITADYHQQVIKLWSLPKGKIEKIFNLSGWFSSRHVTDIALHQGQLLVASSTGQIEVRSLENAVVSWSIQPCKQKANFVSSRASSERIYYRCQSAYGSIHLNNGQWENTIIYSEPGKGERLVSVVELDAHKHAVLGFSNGKVIVMNLKKNTVEQIIQAGKIDSSSIPAYIAYLKNRRKLLVIEQKNKLNIYTYQRQ